MKRIIFCVVALISTALPLADMATADHQRCANVEQDVVDRNLPDWMPSVAHRETGGLCNFEALNTRGEHSIGYMQLNMRSGFFQARGITKDWLLASEDNYWDGVVILYRECGKGPWFPRKVNGKKIYPCLNPTQETWTSTDLFLIAMANAANEQQIHLQRMGVFA